MPLTKVSAGVIAANAVQESVGSQSITGDKLGLTAINANNIVGGSITGDKLGLTAVSSNNIVSVNASVITVGTLPTARLPSNTVLQVVSNTSGNPVTTSGGTFVTSGITASITPTSSSSRILIFSSFPCTIEASSRQLTYTLYKNNTTDIAPNDGNQSGFGQLFQDAGNLQSVCSVTFLDSPATTSSTTYTVYFKLSSGSGSVGVCQNNLTGTITLMEIAG
jgi:hypothetical protein